MLPKNLLKQRQIILEWRRGLRSVSAREKRRSTINQKQVKYEIEYEQKRREQLKEWKKEDEKKLTTWTPWRLELEEKISARKLPMPLSLTGFGDGAKPRYWSQRLYKAFQEWHQQRKAENIPFHQTIPTSVLYLMEKHPELLTEDQKKIYQKYLNDKEEYQHQLSEHVEKPSQVQFPFEILNQIEAEKKQNEQKSLNDPPKLPSGLVDYEYENYLQHHHLLQHLATGLKGISPEDYEDEIAAWSDELWRRNYGTPDRNCPPSNIPCSGCGARLHCTEQSIPGYMPSERFKAYTKNQLLTAICQRCDYLNNYNLSLDVNVDADTYPRIISQIKNKPAIVLLMVDLLDLPTSIWPNILRLIGRKKVYLIGNKVDLLPKDREGYLDRIEDSLIGMMKKMNISEGYQPRYVSLISAKTGFGVEQLVTKLMIDNPKKRDIYLIGCTNVGKSTLFNALLQSDLCKARGRDLISRATVSLWPGTTMNLLKFPVAQPEPWRLQLRHERFTREEKFKVHEARLKRFLYKYTENPRIAMLTDRVSNTMFENIPFTKQSNHPLATRQSSPKMFDASSPEWKNVPFFFDTPGTIYKEQLLTLLTTEELLKTIPREMIVPRTFTLFPYQTLFIAGLARLDLVSSLKPILLTVFASHYLPVHIVVTEQANDFYETFLGTKMLEVPFGASERLEKWPPLLPKEFDFVGIRDTESCGDIVFSSAGWVSITMEHDAECVVKAYTPEGRGIFDRRPSMLPFAVNLRGSKIQGTPCFQTPVANYDEIGDDGYTERDLKILQTGLLKRIKQEKMRLKLQEQQCSYVKNGEHYNVRTGRKIKVFKKKPSDIGWKEVKEI